MKPHLFIILSRPHQSLQQSAINAKLPPVSYIKVVDVWLGACQMFVFGALIEYAFVSYQDTNRQSERSKDFATAKQRKKRQKMEMVDAQIYSPPCTCHMAYDYAELSLRQRISRYFKKPDYLPARIDFYCRWYVPIAFLIFNLIYWTSCLIMSAQSYNIQ